jgi:hypothetical protein
LLSTADSNSASRGVQTAARLELARIRAALTDRVTDCWERLDDVVCELVALHQVPAEAILASVQRTIDAEREPVRSPAAPFD